MSLKCLGQLNLPMEKNKQTSPQGLGNLKKKKGFSTGCINLYERV